MISRSMFSDNKIVDQRITHLVAFFGQFLAHDLTSSPIICIKTKPLVYLINNLLYNYKS